MALTTSHFPDFWSGLNFWLWVGFNCRTLAWYFGSRPWKWENGLLSAEKFSFKLKFDLGDVRWLKVSSQNAHSAGPATYRKCLIPGYSPIGPIPVVKIRVYFRSIPGFHWHKKAELLVKNLPKKENKLPDYRKNKQTKQGKGLENELEFQTSHFNSVKFNSSIYSLNRSVWYIMKMG